MNQSKKDILKEIIRFLIVGGFATICDYIVFYLFNLVILNDLNPDINITISTTLGFITGLLVNWFLQKFVYRYITDNQTKSKSVFIKFVVLSLVGLGITQLGMFIGEKTIFNKLYLDIIITFDFWKIFMKCTLTCIVLVINYIGRKIFVFKINNKEKA
ncbi:MAG: GtrA family protein [Acholeplasmatales bacterium]|nr:GtrA family protein [Acholeplasmatales bacterium]